MKPESQWSEQEWIDAYGPTYRSAGGLLLAAVTAGTYVEPTFAAVEMGHGLTISVAADALKATLPDAPLPLRLPASYADTIAICKTLGCIAPTAAMSDAIWKASTIKIAPKGLWSKPSDSLRMSRVEWTLRHNANIEAALAGKDVKADTLVADVGKEWILDPGLNVLGAVNYGWRLIPGGKPLQPIGHKHLPSHLDYSQVLRPVSRYGALNGQVVDLLDILATQGIAAKWLNAFK